MAPRIRLFVIDKDTGRPKPNVPIGITAEISGEDNKGMPIVHQITLGVLQSDHVGYASAELKDESHLSGADHVWVYPLADEDSRVDVKPTIDFGLDRSVVNVPIPSWIESDPFRRFPAIPAPDATDRDISPRSFANQPELTLGKGGCEEFLLNAVAERTFRFSQIVFNPDQTLASLEPVDSSYNEFSIPTQYRMGALLEYEMQWLPLGHALGEIVYSLPLAPCESVNLAVIEWAREDSAARTEGVELREELIHSQRRDRVIEETVSATLREWQRGGSILGGGSIAGALGGGLFGAFALGGGYSTSSGDRDVNAETIQTIADSVSQATTAARSMFSTVIVQAAQSERDIVETRTVTNHNHCHALTILYYELLRQYRVVTGLAKGTDVILIKKSYRDFTAQMALCNRPYLEPVLLEPRLQACFDALVRVHYEAPATEEPRVQNIRRLIAHVTTGSESAGALGGTSDIQLIIQRTDGTESGPWNLRGDFEENEVDTTTIELDSAIALESVHRVGIKFTSHGDDDWEMKRLRVEYALDEPAGVHLLYDSDTDSDATPPLPHEFEADSRWWGSPLSLEVPEEGPDPAELQRKSDEACARHLIDHLNCHKSYYWRVIWMSQDPGVYATEFDRYPYPPGSSSGRLLDHIELRPVAVIGEYIAFPLNTSEFANKLSRQDSSKPVQRFVSLPTRGVFAEARLSNCCACEERDITKFWDWSESPCPEKAPEISGISLGSRARDIDTTPSDLPAPVVNIVNPPAAPDPTGLANALNLLATSNIFRDMSGRQEVSALLQKLADVAGNLAKAGLSSDDDDEAGSSGGASGSSGGSGSASGRSASTGSRSSDTGLGARETHDRIQVARNAMRGGNISEESGNRLITELTDAMVPRPEPATVRKMGEELYFDVALSGGVLDRIWVWAGGQIPSGAIYDSTHAWWGDRESLGMTDFVIPLNDHDFSSGLGIKPVYMSSADTGVWAPIVSALGIAESKDMRPHLMIFLPPDPVLIQEAAGNLQAIVRMSGTVPRSIHLDLEGWWNSRSASERVAGEAAIRQYFYDEWTAPRPELGIGITHLARDLKTIHALSTVDFAIPQIYASVGNYGRPINKRLVWNDFLRAAEALGSGKRIVVGQTANDDYVTPTIMREMLDLIMRISHPHVGGVREVAFWSDLLLLSNTSIRGYFERLTTVLRTNGLDITNLPAP